MSVKEMRAATLITDYPIAPKPDVYHHMWDVSEQCDSKNNFPKSMTLLHLFMNAQHEKTYHIWTPYEKIC